MRKKKFNILNFIPIAKWLPNYNIKENLLNDIIGGLTVGFIHVPQGMAYASLAGLEPVYGLYTSLFPALVYMIFGTSRHVSLGVFAVVSLMSGSCNLRVTNLIIENHENTTLPLDIESTKIEVVKSLGLLVGIIQLIFGILRANHLISYLSDQIIYGFTTGAAVHVFTAQLNKILGVSLPRHDGFGKLFYIYNDLLRSIIDQKFNHVTLIMSMFTITLLYTFKYYLTPLMCSKTRIPIPYDLFVVILGTIFSKIFNFSDNYHVKIIGEIPTGLPLPSLPTVSLFHYFIQDAIAISIVSVVVTISMGKVFAKKHNYELDNRQEFFALALTESISSLFPCWPSSTALARSIINDNAGTKTQLSSIFSASVLIMVLFFIGPFLETLPTCFLSCIVIVALRGMFLQLRNFYTLWKVSKIDWMIFAITFFATMTYDVVPGLFFGAVSALVFSILRIQRSKPTILTDDDDFPDDNDRSEIVIFYASSLFYFNCESFEKKFHELIRVGKGDAEKGHENVEMTNEKKKVVFNMRGVSDIDLSGVNLLIKIAKDLNSIDRTFTVCNPNEKVMKYLLAIEESKKLLQSS